MAGLLDVFSAGDPYGSMLSPEQQKALQNQALMATGLQMLMASGGQPGMPRPNLGQVVGQGFAAGANTYGNNARTLYDLQAQQQQRQLEQLLMAYKLAGMQRDFAQQDRIAAILNGETPSAAPAEAAPTSAVPPEMAPYLYSAGPAADGGIAGTPAQVQVSADPIPAPANQAIMTSPGVVTAPVPSPDTPVQPLPEVAPPAPVAEAPKLTPNQIKAQKYRQVADAIAATSPDKAEKYYNMADKLDPKSEWSSPQEAMVNGQRVLVQYDKNSERFRVVSGVNPAISLPSEVGAVEYITGQPLAGTGTQGMSKVGEYNKAKAVQVNIGDQQGFKNEQDLRKEFQNLPIYKAHTEVQQAWDQISTALSKPSPANDLVAATKFMKLLDPGSVVRESELAMAMSATGLLDRVQNYATSVINGTKLTPKQRKDFFTSAQALYNAANERYNGVAQQYSKLAKGYNLNPGNVIPETAAPTAAPGQAPVMRYDPKTGEWVR